MQTEEFDSDSSSDDDSDLDDAERKVTMFISYNNSKFNLDTFQEAETRAEALEESISANKMDYDAHVELINLYKLLEDFDSLIAAYERFHQLYPLTPTLWLDWIKIEISIAKHNNQHDRVFKLFNKAVEDYMCKIHLHYNYFIFKVFVNYSCRFVGGVCTVLYWCH